MSAYKFYQWERAKFKDDCAIEVAPNLRVSVAELMATVYGVRLNSVRLVNGSDRGRAWAQDISLPRPAERCSWETIVHEIAHLYCYQKGTGKNHDRGFRQTLIKLVVELRIERERILRVAEGFARAAIENAKAKTEALIAKAEHKAERKAYRKTRAYRIEKVRARVATLERKIKSLSSRLQSAKRSLAALERAEVKAEIASRQQQGVPV